jgi:UDP-N-acetylglucosamine transferase subunit ALG13
MDVLVTVGMGRWPFDRLIAGAATLCTEHTVFVQTGTAGAAICASLDCDHAPFVKPEELRARIHAADVVVTHAGNSVRVVQRTGKVPIAVAREAVRGEMGNDHQVAFLRREAIEGRVVAIWDTADLAAAVAGHPEAERRLLDERPLPALADPDQLAATLDELCAELLR